MSAKDDITNPVDRPPTPIFATTRWTVVLSAGDERSSQHDDALAQLCSSYWYPLYAFIRRQGASPHDAQDLTRPASRSASRSWSVSSRAITKNAPTRTSHTSWA